MNTSADMATQQALTNTLNQSTTLNQMQEYIKKIIDLRGFAEETPQECLLMLVEEVGELAKAIRKTTGLPVDQSRMASYTSVQSEAADVFILLVSLCNAAGINLLDAVIEKEAENNKRTWAVAH